MRQGGVKGGLTAWAMAACAPVVLAQSAGSGTGAGPAGPASVATPQGTVALWRLEPPAAEPGVIWLDRKSLRKTGNQAEFWMFSVSPQDQLVNGKPVAARWTKFLADCPKATAAMLASAAVDKQGTIVSAHQFPEQARTMLLAAPPGSGRSLALARACADDSQRPAPTPLAASAGAAIQWSRDPAAWQAARQSASEPAAPTTADRIECGHAYDTLAGALGQIKLVPSVYGIDRASLPALAIVEAAMRERATMTLRSVDGVVRAAAVGERIKPWSRAENGAPKAQALLALNRATLACDRQLRLSPVKLP